MTSDGLGTSQILCAKSERSLDFRRHTSNDQLIQPSNELTAPRQAQGPQVPGLHMYFNLVLNVDTSLQHAVMLMIIHCSKQHHLCRPFIPEACGKLCNGL